MLQPFSPEEIECILQANPRTMNLSVRREVMHAIACREKIKTKIPFYYTKPELFYPQSLSLEQASSERSALFKASLVHGNSLLDLTGGFGVDSFFFSQRFEEVDYVEQQEELKEIASYNFNLLGANHIKCYVDEASRFLQHQDKTYDVIYLDPARRNSQGNKTVLFADCTPNAVQLLPQLRKRGKAILIKTSPLMDIHAALHDLQDAAQVVVVAIQNECKELLFLLTEQHKPQKNIMAIDLAFPDRCFTFSLEEEKQQDVEYSLPELFIYEANAAIMKAGAFKSVAHQFGLKKLHPNTHLYTSTEQIAEFPGRCFQLIELIKPQAKHLDLILPDRKANLILRNFPGSASDLQKKLKIKDGGDYYLLACTLHNEEKMMLYCKRLA